MLFRFSVILFVALAFLGNFAAAQDLKDLKARYSASLKQGDFAESLTLGEQALGLAEAEYGSTSVQLRTILNHLAAVNLRLNNFDAAEKILQPGSEQPGRATEFGELPSLCGAPESWKSV